MFFLNKPYEKFKEKGKNKFLLGDNKKKAAIYGWLPKIRFYLVKAYNFIWSVKYK